jgi:hypothetical protein
MLAQTWQGVKRYIMYRFNRLIRHPTLVGRGPNLVGRGSRRAATKPARPRSNLVGQGSRRAAMKPRPRLNLVGRGSRRAANDLRIFHPHLQNSLNQTHETSFPNRCPAPNSQ